MLKHFPEEKEKRWTYLQNRRLRIREGHPRQHQDELRHNHIHGP